MSHFGLNSKVVVISTLQQDTPATGVVVDATVTPLSDTKEDGVKVQWDDGGSTQVWPLTDLKLAGNPGDEDLDHPTTGITPS